MRLLLLFEMIPLLLLLLQKVLRPLHGQHCHPVERVAASPTVWSPVKVGVEEPVGVGGVLL